MHRCSWAGSDPLMIKYHDEEWGVPEFNSRTLWETLMLEGFQAGLSWLTVLRRREGFRQAFDQFDPLEVARYSEEDIDRLMQDTRIIRARAKIVATIGGARAYLQMQDGGTNFSDFIWQMAGGKPIPSSSDERLTQSPLSVKFSKEFKRRGFKFVGPVIVYAWMQAVGIVNDHDSKCFRRDKCQG